MTTGSYRQWLDVARRYSRGANDAEDLLQESLLAALKAHRQPLENNADAPWFHGVIRNHAAMRARTAVRERARENAAINPDEPAGISIDEVHAAEWREIAALPDGLRRVLVLALNGLDRAGIRQVLDISDAALRRRLSELRKHLDAGKRGADFHALAAAYASRLAQNNPPGGGLRRAALARGPAKLDAFRFAIADPDSTMLAISDKPSQNDRRRQQQDELPPINRPDETE